MKPFDLEAAKRGEKIVILSGSASMPMSQQISVTYIGMASLGRVVFEYANGKIDACDAGGVFMPPRKVVKWKWMDLDSRRNVYDSKDSAETMWRGRLQDEKLCRIEWEE